MTTTQTEYDHKVSVPEGQLDGMRIERFEVTSQGNRWASLRDACRAPSPGTYTRLTEGGRLWMSDTPAEWADHRIAVRMIRRPETRRVLINGLGIGMVLQAALACDHVEHVDVVEVDPRVVALVGPHYLRDPRVTIHTADAYTYKWPTGITWDVAWHDIWPDLCIDNLPKMERLHRRHGRMVTWQGSWGRELTRAYRERERRRSSRWGMT